MKILRFHTGRGGRYFNGGHVTFMRFEAIQESCAWDSYFQRENGLWYDENGNELDCQINPDGTWQGYISDDGIYDSDHWVREDYLNDKQVEALIRFADQDIAATFPQSDEAEAVRILREHYPHM